MRAGRMTYDFYATEHTCVLELINVSHEIKEKSA